MRRILPHVTNPVGLYQTTPKRVAYDDATALAVDAGTKEEAHHGSNHPHPTRRGVVLCIVRLVLGHALEFASIGNPSLRMFSHPFAFLDISWQYVY